MAYLEPRRCEDKKGIVETEIGLNVSGLLRNRSHEIFDMIKE